VVPILKLPELEILILSRAEPESLVKKRRSELKPTAIKLSPEL
jgi:hypothetical protein